MLVIVEAHARTSSLIAAATSLPRLPSDELAGIRGSADTARKLGSIRRSLTRPASHFAWWVRMAKGAVDCTAVVERRDHAAMATPVTSAQVVNAWRPAE
jgi:hypothetical protein